MILIKKECQAQVIQIKTDQEGRILILELKIESKIIVLCNLYAPNRDTPSFFIGIEKLVSEMSEHRIIIGDFNLALQSKDRYRFEETKRNSKEALYEIIENLVLTDIWRERHPDKLHFSWQRRNPRKQASRIDYALTSCGLASYVENVMYVPSIKTDHQAFFLAIDLLDKQRGKGYWRLNVSKLTDKEFVDCINKCIEEALAEYQGNHPCTIWENLKEKVAKVAKRQSRKKCSENQLAISQLLEQIGLLEENMELDENQENLLLYSKVELDKLVEEQARGTLFRSKAKWQEEGEKSTKYFFNLEKSRYNAKTCHMLVHEGRQVTEDKDILSIEQKYYEKLYTKDEDVEFRATNTYDIKVNTVEREAQEREITLNEMATAIKELKNNKTPGEDGLPVEFYKVFFGKIGELLLDVYMCAYEEKCMCKTTMTGILNLIPKPGKDARNIDNLRPITLLNVDYKIIEKILAKRMEKSMYDVIHQDQKGFMKGRRISGNIRKILDLIYQADQKQLNAIILSLDYKKCFDMISFDAILGALEFFKFSHYIIQWTEILYTDYTVKIQNNGYFSDLIYIRRGVHQGGVNSVYYFLLVAEVLALSLRDNQRIKGIPINDILNLLGQFADDMDMYLLAEQDCLDAMFECIERFHHQTGFTVNYDKTKILRIGSLKNTDAKLISQREVAWINEPINILGVWVGHDEKELLEKNYRPLIEKARATLKLWSQRSLSLIGRISIINTLVGSLFVYKMTVLPTMPQYMVKELEQEFRKFIWKGKKAKIALTKLMADKKAGGLKLIDIKRKDMALKVSWVQMLEEDPSLANLAHEAIQPILKSWIFDCNLDIKDVKDLEIQNSFWRDMLRAWCAYNFRPRYTQDQSIWYNSLIKIQNRTIFWEKAYQKGLFRISQLFEAGELKSIRKVQDKFGLNFLDYHALIKAIPKEIIKQIKKEVLWDSNLAKILDSKHIVKDVYCHLIQDIGCFTKCKDKWEEELGEAWSNKEFCGELRKIYKVTNVTKYCSFQYRLLNRALVLNTHLYRWGMREDDLCSFCQAQTESITHLLVYCDKVQHLWRQLQNFATKYTKDTLNQTCKAIVCNRVHDRAEHIVNFMCLITKQYIYRKRCLGEELNFKELKLNILKQEKVEKYIAVKNNKQRNHFSKWYSTQKEQDIVEIGICTSLSQRGINL